MRIPTKIILAAVITAFCFSPSGASAEDVGGVWIKTTHPDPQNVSIFYTDSKAVKAMGYGRIAGAPAIWFAEGRYREGLLVLRYRYSPNATPQGWEPDGTMTLTVSQDGDTMSGMARSQTGNWSGPVVFRRIELAPGGDA